MNRSRSEIFTPNEGNLGGVLTVNSQHKKHKIAVQDARSMIKSLVRPHSHVDSRRAAPSPRPM